LRVLFLLFEKKGRWARITLWGFVDRLSLYTIWLLWLFWQKVVIQPWLLAGDVVVGLQTTCWACSRTHNSNIQPHLPYYIEEKKNVSFFPVKYLIK
jgi:hypothetical protein